MKRVTWLRGAGGAGLVLLTLGLGCTKPKPLVSPLPQLFNGDQHCPAHRLIYRERVADAAAACKRPSINARDGLWESRPAPLLTVPGRGYTYCALVWKP